MLDGWNELQIIPSVGFDVNVKLLFFTTQVFVC